MGQGDTLYLDEVANEFLLQTIANAVDVYVDALSPFGDSWSFTFAAPNGTQLAVGDYEGASRQGLFGGRTAGLAAGGRGRGCNQATGRFSVLEIAFGPTGSATTLAVDFEQHCEGAEPALFGQVRMNSTVPIVVPEPAVVALLCGGLLLVASRRRRTALEDGG